MDKREEAIEKTFPGAITIDGVLELIEREIERLGFTKKLVKPAKATCRDDSVSEIEDVLRKRGYLSAFHMETLSGMSVFGKTAVCAHYHHIPDNGMGLIIYGPHIGIDKTGRLGYFERAGIKEAGKSCGANHALLTGFKSGSAFKFEDDPELSNVAHEIGMKPEHIKQIIENTNPLLKLTEVEYEKGLAKLSSLVSAVQQSEHHHFPILLVAGVHLDLEHGLGNRFQLREIRVYDHGKFNAVYSGVHRK